MILSGWPAASKEVVLIPQPTSLRGPVVSVDYMFMGRESIIQT
jgi:hypothetical protein